MAKGKCRGCGCTLTSGNARRYEGRWVGACRECESQEAQDRYYAKRERAAK